MILLAFCMLQPMTATAMMTAESQQLAVNTGMLGLLAVIVGQNQYTIMHGLPIVHKVLEQQSASDEPKIEPVTWRPSDDTQQSNRAGGAQLAEDFHTNAKAAGDPVVAASTRRAQEELALCHDGADMQALLSNCCVDGGGQHRPTRTGCGALPDQCSRTCAPLFLAFYSSCPSLAAGIEGAAMFQSKCAAVGQSAQPPPPLPPTPSPPPPLTMPPLNLGGLISDGRCTDSPTWISQHGHARCSQYNTVQMMWDEQCNGDSQCIADAATVFATPSWHPMCHVDRGSEHGFQLEAAIGGCEEIDDIATSEECKQQAAMVFSQTVLIPAAIACPVACGTCPRCDDSIRNGGETGIDCGGPCPACTEGDCPLFSESGLLPANMEVVCSGNAEGDSCIVAASRGYTTLSSLAELSVDCQDDPECLQHAAMASIPPPYVVPNRFVCGNGQWSGSIPLPVMPINDTACPRVVTGFHYSGTCDDSKSPCHATCEDGYPWARGSGVFTCIDGRWMGDLVCHAVTCGPTLDKKPISESGFSICTDGDEIGDTCTATCKEGFYSQAGTGSAVFTCDDIYDGTWLQQGDPWFHSSLVCKRCPTIEHCVVSSCSTGSDAVCAVCEAGFYSFRHYETPTRCLPASVTMMAASFTADATGIFVFVVPENTTLQAGNGGSVAIPSSASLTVHGSADGSSVLVVESVSIEGVCVISGVVIEASFDVTNGGSLSLQSVGGSITGLSVVDSHLSMDARSTATLGGTIQIGNAGAVELTQKTIVTGSNVAVSGAGTELSLSSSTLDGVSLRLSGGSSVALQSVGGSMDYGVLEDSHLSMDAVTKSQLELRCIKGYSGDRCETHTCCA